MIKAGDTIPFRAGDVIVFVPTRKVQVRWWDGCYEEFQAVEARAGSDLLWLKLEDQETRHIPLRHVRWFSGLY